MVLNSFHDILYLLGPCLLRRQRKYERWICPKNQDIAAIIRNDTHVLRVCSLLHLKSKTLLN